MKLDLKQLEFILSKLTKVILSNEDESIRFTYPNTILITIVQELRRCAETLEATNKFLDKDIATLECSNRVRTMYEYEWDHAMFLRDENDKALAALKEKIEL